MLDEVSNGLAYYNYTFMDEVPRLYQMVERQVRAYAPELAQQDIASFLRLGSWIGGDRDGNPYVDADVVRRPLRCMSTRVLGHYLDELHGSAPSCRSHPARRGLGGAARPRRALAGHLAASHGEPYRRAIIAIHGRIAATLRASSTELHPRQARAATVSLTERAEEFHRDLDDHRPLSAAPIPTIITRGRLRSLRRAALLRLPSRAASTCGRTPTCMSAPSPNC